MEITFITKNPQETKKLGQKLASFLKGGELICLEGELGGGKTTFLKGLAEGLLIKEKIQSPTFIIFRSYFSKKKNLSLFHFDLYRIENEEELNEIGFQEMLQNKNTIVAIEWAEKIKKILPQKKLEIKFFYIDENQRKIKFLPQGNYYSKIIEKIKRGR